MINELKLDVSRFYDISNGFGSTLLVPHKLILFCIRFQQERARKLSMVKGG